MIAPFDRKMVLITAPAALYDNASLTTTAVDTRGWNYAVLTFLMGATDIAVTALKVQESDDNGSSDAYDDIVGTRFGTDANDTGSTSTLPSATDDNKFFSFFIDLRGRERYLDLVATFGDGTAGGYAAAWCELYRGEDAPRLATEAGYAQRMVV